MKIFLYSIYDLLIANVSFIPSYYRRKAKNPHWLLMFFFSRFYWIRKIVLFFCRSNTVKQHSANNSIFEKLNVKYIVKIIEKEGYYQGLQIPQTYVDKILDFALTNDCYGEGNLDRSFRYDEYLKAKSIYSGNIMRCEYTNTLDMCPAIKAISQDPQILSIANTYLKTEAVLMNTRLWWNLIVNDSNCDLRKGARTFHYDPDDYGCIAFAFYITDVDTDTHGPHVCVRGSHKKKKITSLLSLSLNSSDREIIKDYGQENLVKITGKSGYGFIEDKFIFHKANSPLERERLILYIQFGINNYHKK